MGRAKAEMMDIEERGWVNTKLMLGYMLRIKKCR